MPNANHHDAELILKLYDLRRESEMRKARTFLGFEFWPNSAEDFAKISSGDPNRYWRQGISFWSMAADLVLHGALDESLFLDTAGEMFFFFAKFKPFLADIRKTQPDAFKSIETLINRSEAGKQKLAVFEQRVAGAKQRMQQAAKA
jgi:hypothetical protein